MKIYKSAYYLNGDAYKLNKKDLYIKKINVFVLGSSIVYNEFGAHTRIDNKIYCLGHYPSYQSLKLAVTNTPIILTTSLSTEECECRLP